MMGFTPLVTIGDSAHIVISDDFQELQSLQTFGGIFCPYCQGDRL